MQKSIIRIIDANYNRSREGLRVCEDIMRFSAGERRISKNIKEVRHAITDIMTSSHIKKRALLSARDARNDVGRKPVIESEFPRADLKDVFFANIQRAKESIRVLEELLKLADVNISKKMSALRFRVYDIEKSAYSLINKIRS